MEKKMTKREYFNAIKAVVEAAGQDEMVKFIDHEIKLLDKKASYKSDKPTATQKANEEIKAVLLEVLSETSGKTVTELIKSDARLGDLSNQKVSAILRLMKKDGIVRDERDKKKTLFYKDKVAMVEA